MERILIVGCPGAGKSTLARALAKKLDLPVVHLDQLYWLPGWVSREKDEFDLMLRSELEKPRWIVDGNYGRTLPLRLQYCDTVIFLDFSTAACLRGVLKRVFTTRGTVRSDMAEGCPERFDWAFLNYVRTFRRTHWESLMEKIFVADPSVKRIFLQNRRQVKRFLKQI